MISATGITSMKKVVHKHTTRLYSIHIFLRRTATIYDLMHTGCLRKQNYIEESVLKSVFKSTSEMAQIFL